MISITSLPDEVITLILRNNNCFEVIRFGTTCKKMYDLVCNHQLLWKDKLKNIIPKDIFDIINNRSDKNWFQEVKNFHSIKKNIFTELSLMSPKYYWQINEISFEEVDIFFNIALTNNVSYYYTIYILQELMRKGNQILKDHCGIKPYTLTDMYYAHIILRHLINTYLTVKWGQSQIKKELHPEFVVNFFVQWVDSMNMHCQEEVENIISNLVTKVEMILVKRPSMGCTSGSKIKDMCERGQISERQVLAAVTKVIYHQPHMAVTITANLDTLDIVKVMNNKCGNVLVLGAIYQAVARRCGVKCNLIAFPNHLFLEWQDSRDIRYREKYKIDLGSGELQPKRGCPFSGHGVNTNYNYSPDLLLQYILGSFSNTMGVINNWYMRNASYLVDFMNTDPTNLNPYSNFLRMLLDHAQQPTVNTPIDIKYFHEMNREIILLLTQYAKLCNTKRPMRTDITVKRHDSRVKYAVGMLCYHRKSEYVCIIRGWDLSCASQFKRMSDISSFQYGMNQPFYHVVAADQSKRYVPQENLIEVMRPNRLYHLEDVIAKEFTHFNGFAYVPNNEKLTEYPEDNTYVSVFQNRAEIMTRQITRSPCQNT